MYYNDLITSIFQVCIIPLLSVLTAFFVKWVNVKSNEIKVNIDDATLVKYIDMLNSTITDCVIATNQTYVEALKQQGKFDIEAQKTAFQMTSKAVLDILSDDNIVEDNTLIEEKHTSKSTYTLEDYKKMIAMLKELKQFTNSSNISVDDAINISLISNYSIDDCLKFKEMLEGNLN